MTKWALITWNQQQATFPRDSIWISHWILSIDFLKGNQGQIRKKDLWATEQRGILRNCNRIYSIVSPPCAPEKKWWLNSLSTWGKSESSRNTLQGELMKIFPKRFNWVGKIYPECDWHHAMVWGFRFTKKDEKENVNWVLESFSLCIWFPDCPCNVIGHFTVPIPYIFWYHGVEILFLLHCFGQTFCPRYQKRN